MRRVSALPRNADRLKKCFERTVKYLKEREQFSVPSARSGMKHRAGHVLRSQLSKSVVLER
jgi:hypothetical protein